MTAPSPDDLLIAAAGAADPRAAVAAVLGERYDQARERAAQKLASGQAGVEVARQYCAAADVLMTSLWRLATEVLYPAPNPTEAERLCVLAVGGYGRGVLAPFSDLDLMFLRPWKTTPRSEQIVEFVQYVLWDLNLKVGASTRSIDEALTLAWRDMTVRTALLEARFLAGDEGLAEGFLARFRREATQIDPRPFIAAKLEERETRHQKAGAFRYRVEPNVKDGKGGLRDLNTLFWIARGLAPDSHLGARALEGLLTARERRLFEEAFDFLWRVRANMHIIAGRAEERLTFDLQPEIARRMGWRGRGDELAVERFMRRYFIVARDVGALTRAVSAQLEARQQKKAMGLSRLLPRRRKRLPVKGLVIEGGRLSIAGPGVFESDPPLLLKLFAEADRLDLDLHPDAFSAVTRALPLVTPALRRDPEAAQAFLTVLAHGQRPYRALTIMNETGLLGRFLPEWGRIVGQTQFNMYHAYTVDEHTLQAVGVINDIARGKLAQDHPLSTGIVHRIADFEALMLAMLLHDVGKGGDRGQLEDGAIAARRACERLGVEPRRIELVVWLVRHHLTLSDYAQKRDVSDPETVRAFAAVVGDLERLRTLVVLTVADIRAVGPGVWNSWKGQLMRDLYGRTEALFHGEDIGRADPLAQHPELVERARETGAAAEAFMDDEGGGLRVAVAARDRQGLFADLAAALAALGADVAGARLATSPDGMALDVFDLHGEPDARRLKRLTLSLERAALGRSRPTPLGPEPLSARRAVFDVRPVVMIGRASDQGPVILEVSGADRPGLLADLGRTLADHDLSVRSAHVATFGERAVDSFYLDREPESPAALKMALEAVLDRSLPIAPGRRPAPVRASARDVSEIGRLPSPQPISRRRKAR